MSWTLAVNMQQPTKVTLASATTAQLADVADAVNTSDAKVAGALIFNSTVGSVVVASGPLAGDAWNTITTGVAAHSPV